MHTYWPYLKILETYTII